ncbi:DUF1640 domain-containing protein [Arsenophonus sp. PmNCSU2021_1]|uniref:DUF1640 domain-containing protein n=1 Tax=Arsenophonus sp. PmNCSU2021_1 TaxID=3118989 RepID=UPI002FF34CB4
MGQVAFDTQEFVETLENAGLPKEQAKAISIAVRKSHKVADVATKRDLEDVRKDMVARFEKNEAQIADVRKDLSAEIADVRKDLSAEMNLRFEKTDAQIADVRKDLSAEISNVRKDLSSDIALVRKDVEALTNSLLIKLSAVMLGIVSAATAILKFF